jgi:hypothetical protein
MKRSTILYIILLGMFIALLIAGFTIPQEVLDYYEIYFLWIILPIMGFLWFRAYIDGMKGN